MVEQKQIENTFIEGNYPTNSRFVNGFYCPTCNEVTEHEDGSSLFKGEHKRFRQCVKCGRKKRLLHSF